MQEVATLSPEETYPDELPERLEITLRGSSKGYAARTVHRVLAGIRAGLPFTEALQRESVSKDDWFRWCDLHPELRELQLKSREVGSHALAEQCLELADRAEEDRDAIAKAKLRIDTRLKLMGMWNRQFYGDETQVQANHTFTIQADLGAGATLPRDGDP